MDITPLVPKGQNLISAYGKNYVVINGQKYVAPLIISPNQLILNTRDLSQLSKLDTKPEIILIGHHLKQMRVTEIQAETMSFGAACRTYNILLTEGREVACILME
jgi:uncharacterized protein